MSLFDYVQITTDNDDGDEWKLVRVVPIGTTGYHSMNTKFINIIPSSVSEALSESHIIKNITGEDSKHTKNLTDRNDRNEKNDSQVKSQQNSNKQSIIHEINNEYSPFGFIHNIAVINRNQHSKKRVLVGFKVQ